MPKGKKAVTVPVPAATPSSLVLATLQHLLGSIHVQAASAATGSITITLSGTPTAALPVAYFVLG